MLDSCSRKERQPCRAKSRTPAEASLTCLKGALTSYLLRETSQGQSAAVCGLKRRLQIFLQKALRKKYRGGDAFT
jgi:hypothetical protein